MWVAEFVPPWLPWRACGAGAGGEGGAGRGLDRGDAAGERSGLAALGSAGRVCALLLAMHPRDGAALAGGGVGDGRAEAQATGGGGSAGCGGGAVEDGAVAALSREQVRRVAAAVGLE